MAPVSPATLAEDSPETDSEDSTTSSPEDSPRSLPPWVGPLETAEARGKRLKSEPPPPLPWELKRYEDLTESDFSIYDDISEPYTFRYKDFVYRNKAQKELNKAVAKYRQESRNRDEFDAIAPPPNSALSGVVIPNAITDDELPKFIEFCNCALEKYHAENQNATFVFEELVKCNSQPVNGLMHYITFKAKDAAGITETFQAKVWDKVRKNEKPEAIMCRIKPT